MKHFNAIPNIIFINVEWSAPDLWERNGIITHYIIKWGETGNLQLTTYNYSVPNPTFNTTDDQRYTFRDLKPITEYIFNIAAVNINGTGPVLKGMSTTLEEGICTYMIILINFYWSSSRATHICNIYTCTYVHSTWSCKKLDEDCQYC